MRLLKPLLALALGTTLALPAAAASFRDTSVPMKSQNVDIQKYLGKWYEIARYPNSFEKGCTNVTAEYTKTADGVGVLNSCNGRTRSADARVVAPGQLKVNFVKWLPMAEGDYWVLYVDPSYSLAVVGEPTGKYGWILSRSPQVRQSQLDKAYSVLRANGYDTSKIYLTPQ